MKLFITGTDTEVGKTFVSTGFLALAKQQGKSCIGLKPIAAGASFGAQDTLENDDALSLQQASSLTLPYEVVNPFVFELPVAPHLAAQQAGVRLDVSRIVGMINGAFMTYRADVMLVEGAGGWMLPINEREVLPQVVKQLQLPVVMVVGMKLGCLNHAFLTMMAIEQMGCKLVGWVANQIDPTMSLYEENIATLKKHINAPCLGVVPYLKGAAHHEEAVAHYLTFP